MARYEALRPFNYWWHIVMITLITGAPGAGKTAALVSILQDLAKNRTIYVNGIPDLSIDHQPLEKVETWHETVPDGSAIVIDEVQRFWRARGPGARVPAEVAALETHRHRGLDFYIITQGPNLLDSNVRALVGRHVHLRDVGILGRYWYEWAECCDNVRTAWKNAPLKKRYRLPKSIFNSYKSASQHIKPVRSFPMMLVFMLAALVGTGFLVWKSYSTVSAKMNPLPALNSPAAASASPGGSSASSSLPVLPSFDITAFMPRIPTMPESAPVYDELRKVVSMPVVIGGACMGQRCKCYTNQGTNAGLTDSECRSWIDDRPFNPYKIESQPQQTTLSGSPNSDSKSSNEFPYPQAKHDGSVIASMRKN